MLCARARSGASAGGRAVAPGLPVRLQLARRDGTVNRGYEAGGHRIEAALLEHINVLFYRQITIGHPRAGDAADGATELNASW